MVGIDQSSDVTLAGSGELRRLYRRAFAEFGVRALWNLREQDEPTRGQILAIARQLRAEGDMNARRLAEEIEQASRAAL